MPSCPHDAMLVVRRDDGEGIHRRRDDAVDAEEGERDGDWCGRTGHCLLCVVVVLVSLIRVLWLYSEQGEQVLC